MRARRAGHPPAGQRLDRRGRRCRRRRPRGRPSLRGHELQDRSGGPRRRVHRALERRHAEGSRPRRALGARRRLACRPERRGRGRDRRPSVRHPRSRPDPRGGRDRRPGDDRLGGEHLPGRPRLPVQGGRDGGPDLRERDLGVDAAHAHLRRGRRLGPRQRRPHRRGRGAPRGCARDGPRSGNARGRQPRVTGGVPDDPARRDHGAHRGGRGRRRPARLAVRRDAPRPQDAGARCRRSRRAERARPRAGADPDLRVARHPADRWVGEGDREELHAAGAAPLGLRGGRADDVSDARPRELRAGPRRRDRHGGRCVAAATGSPSTSASRRPRSCFRSCSARSEWMPSPRTASSTRRGPTTHHWNRLPTTPRGSSRRSPPTSASCSTGRGSGSSSSTNAANGFPRRPRCCSSSDCSSTRVARGRSRCP